MKLFSLGLMIAAAVMATTAAAQQPAAKPPPGPASGKIGYVNPERVMLLSRSTRKAKQDLDEKYQRLVKEIDAGPQDPADQLKAEETLADWLGRWRRKERPEQDDLIVRATLGQLLFSGDEQKKMLSVISGGEGQRMMIGKLVLQMPNVMLLDEPTNHLDMESIESLNTALDKYTGTLIFVTPRKTRFIFTDRGEKEYIECTRAEIARRLHAGEAEVMAEEPEVPFFERIMGSVISKMSSGAGRPAPTTARA